MKEEKYRRSVLLPIEIDNWLVEKSKQDFRSVSGMLAKLLENIRNEEALDASTPKALVETPNH